MGLRAARGHRRKCVLRGEAGAGKQEEMLAVPTQHRPLTVTISLLPNKDLSDMVPCNRRFRTKWFLVQSRA